MLAMFCDASAGGSSAELVTVCFAAAGSSDSGGCGSTHFVVLGALTTPLCGLRKMLQKHKCHSVDVDRVDPRTSILGFRAGLH